MLVDNFQGHPVPIVPKAVMSMMRNSMNADISYYKAWKGKELADNMLKDNTTQSFTKLTCYLHMVEQMNRGSITDIFVDEENRFKYMFLAFGACVRGYRSMRKVVSIDGTWLKGKYNGVLLVASAQDGNYHQYPLAWGIVDVECTSSWSWFLTKLLEVVPDEDELVIISDMHQGIINAVSSVYRNAHHGHCTWHLSQNMKIRCKKKGATEMFLRIAKIYKGIEFDIAYNEFRNRYPEAAQYLDEKDSLDRWTRAYCPKTRYNIMTTNGFESINARILEERKLPIIALLDSLQKLTSSWFARYRHASIASNSNMTPTIEGILRSRFTDAQGMQVFELGRLEFDVRSRGHSAIVDLESKRCTCRVFDIDRIPCAHAIAASGLANIDLYDMCSEYYSTMSWCMAYSETVYLVPEENEWPRNINFPFVLPPLLEKRVGRRKQNRIPSIGEFSKR
ncbi:uncharacterized protein LOC142544377 [Primulina tabacum]|uniref:uncharacterized protein LOC142544377 n=1 Tax=Primulina tabacum TaxID=48773 RepID=UPI003F59A34A